MKKRVITIGVLMMSGIAFSQVGIGVKSPHKSALLELKADKGDYRGVLIPRIPLNDLTDKSNINKGDVETSLLVFNTTNNTVLSSGFYYWNGAKWVRLLNNQDILDNIDSFPRNKVLEVRDDVLVLEDSKGLEVKTPIKDLNIVTTITEGDNGKYIYKNELGDIAVIDVTGSVINNIEEILKDTTVQNTIYTTVAAQGKEVSSTDGSIQVDNGGKAALNEMQLSIAKGGVTPEKIAPGSNKQILITNASGEVVWVDATDEVIKDAVKHNETVTVLEDKGNGTFTYFSEADYDKEGNKVGKGVDFNANTLSIVERKGKEQGIYDFFDGEHKDTPLMTISTRANSIYFDNSSTTIEGDNLQEVIENIINKIEIAHGTPSTIKGGTEILINGKTELGDAVLKEMTLSIAPGAITTEKIEAGGKKQILITNAKGDVVWVDANEEVIKEIVKSNETVTVLEDKGNGTFVYYNEEAIDKDGKFIEEKAVKFDSNTLRIIAQENGKYAFFDGRSETVPVAVIDVTGTVIENITEILNNKEVKEQIYTTVAAQGHALENADKSIVIEGGEQAVLFNTKIAVADKGITTKKIKNNAVTPGKIAPGNNKQILITNASGEVVWVDATDEVIKDAVKHNETVTVLEDKGNGTFTYFSEADYDKEGNKVGKGVDFNANTLSIVERKGKEQGIYDFFDGEHKDTPLMTISTRANSIYFDNSSTTIEGDNLQEVIENIINKIEVAQGTPSSIIGGEILINGETELGEAVLKEMTLSIAPGAITTEKIEAGGKKQILITNAKGEVVWVDANEEVIKEIVKSNETVTVLEDKGNGTFTYFSEADYDKEGNKVGKGVDFNANTLSIVERKGKEKGIYDFFDGEHKDTPLMTISTRANSIYFDNSSTTIEGDNLQEVIENIINKIEVAQGTPSSIIGGEILINGETELGEAVLKEMTLSIAPGAITTEKIEAGGKKQILITNAKGEVVWVDANEEVIKEIVKSNETVTVLEDKGNGTFTYFSEADYDKEGNKVGEGVDFNANTLSIVERKGKEKGIYDFFDGEHKDTPLMTISTRANSIYFDNSSTTIEGDNLQEVIENIINKIEIAQGTPSSIIGGEILINGETELGEAVLKEMTLSIAPGAIITEKIANKAVTTEKIAPGTDKYILVTKNKKVKWVPASDSIIKEVVKQNETITVLDTNANDGTFIYYSEKDFDAKGNIIKGSGTSFDANTLTITDSGKGKYIFRDGKTKTGTPLAEIDILGTVIENITEVLSNTEVKEQIFEVVSAQGKKLEKGDDSILIEGGDKAVLANTTISVAPKGITTDKIAPGTDKFLLVTKGEKVEWVSASDSIIKEVVKENETVTLIVDEKNGTFTYYNEKGIDEKGNIIKGSGTSFDANTLTITDNKKGKYIFRDGKTKTGTPLAEIDILGTVIENITEILNNKEVKEQIYTTVAAQGKKVSGDTAIEITGGDKAALNAMTISLKNEGVTPEKIAAGSKKQILITNAEGKVQWVDANEEVIKEVVQKNERITRLEAKENGTFMYYNELAVNEKGEVIGEGVEFDANTLTILEDTPGIFTFSDKKGKIKDLDIRASNIIVDDSTIGSGNDNVQDVLETIFEIINNINNQKRDLKGKGILVNGGSVVEKALLEEVELSIADNAITTTKLAANAVTTVKVANHAITEDKLWAGKGRDKQVAVVQADGSVKFQEFNAVVTGKMLSVDNSLTVEGDASKALLNPLEIKVNELGIVTKHIDHNAVTAAKIGSEEATLNAVLAANGSGGSAFTPVSTVVSSAMQGDIEGDDAIKVTGGDNVLFGDDKKKATITLNERGIKGGHIATKTILNENIADTTIAATKLNGGTDNVNAVATVIDTKGTVAYQPLTSGAISDKAALKTDGIITIGGLNQQEGTLLKEATLSIAPKGINTTQIADNAVDNLQIADLAVSSDKITSGTVGTGRVLLSDVDGKTKWGELDDITTQLAGDLITDEIIQLTSQDGDGQKALLKDVKLSINENSITKSKLSSVEGGVNTAEDMLLVADGRGGFKYIKKEIMAIETEDLTLGSALTFTNGSNGIDAVLVNTSIDVNDLGISTAKLAEGAVTTGKISSVGANQNTVLTADGSGKVAYKKLTNSAFEGQEANLLSDGSLLIPANNKAVLTETTIGIAESGVKTQHIANRAVTADKIGAEGTTNGLVLVTKDGGAEFSALSDAISGTGKDITEGSAITVTNGKQAALKEVTIDVKNLGITNAKIAERTIQASKFDAKGTAAGTVLTSMGDGEAKYAPLNQFAKPLGSDSSIEVSTNKGVLLADATIKVKDLGIGTQHLGANAVTTEKISSKVGAGVADKQQLLMADGKGGVYFGISENVVTKGNITNGTTISATKGGVGAVFQDVTLEVTGLSIDTGHIKDYAISPAKLNKNAVTAEKIDTNAVIADKIANNAVTTDKINANAVTEAKLADNAVTTAKIEDDAISFKKIKDSAIRKNHIYIQNIEEKHFANEAVSTRALEDAAVTTDKMSAGNAPIGYVLTVEKDGKVAFKETSGESSYGNGDLKESGTIIIEEGNGKGSLFSDLKLKVKNTSIGQDHLTYNAVGSGELQNAAVENRHIEDLAVTDSKISSDGAEEGDVLIADDNGGAYWGKPSGGNDSGNGDFEESETIEIEGEEDGRGNGAFFKDLKFNVKGGSIGQDHLTYDAVGSGELQDDAVNNEHIADHAVTDSKISSDGIEGGYVLTADGEGGVVWEEQTGGNDSGNGELEESDTIGIESGYADGALFHDLQLKVKEGSIDTEHIAGDAIQNHHIEDRAVSEEKIFSDDADDGDVLIADGYGGARWGKLTGGSGNISSPKFFYLPAIYIDMVSGKSDSIEIYDYYADQFGSPMLSSTGDSTLPVYGKDELNYYVTYYDEAVFEDMRLDYDGELHYKVKDGATPTGRTFFNIVLEVK